MTYYQRRRSYSLPELSAAERPSDYEPRRTASVHEAPTWLNVPLSRPRAAEVQQPAAEPQMARTQSLPSMQGDVRPRTPVPSERTTLERAMMLGQFEDYVLSHGGKLVFCLYRIPRVTDSLLVDYWHIYWRIQDMPGSPQYSWFYYISSVSNTYAINPFSGHLDHLVSSDFAYDFDQRSQETIARQSIGADRFQRARDVQRRIRIHLMADQNFLASLIQFSGRAILNPTELSRERDRILRSIAIAGEPIVFDEIPRRQTTASFDPLVDQGGAFIPDFMRERTAARRDGPSSASPTLDPSRGYPHYFGPTVGGPPAIALTPQTEQVPPDLVFDPYIGPTPEDFPQGFQQVPIPVQVPVQMPVQIPVHVPVQLPVQVQIQFPIPAQAPAPAPAPAPAAAPPPSPVPAPGEMPPPPADQCLVPLIDFTDYVILESLIDPYTGWSLPDIAPPPFDHILLQLGDYGGVDCTYFNPREQTLYDTWHVYVPLHGNDSPTDPNTQYVYMVTARNRYIMGPHGLSHHQLFLHHSDFAVTHPITAQSHGISAQEERTVRRMFDWIQAGFRRMMTYRRFWNLIAAYRTPLLNNPTQRSRMRDGRINLFMKRFGPRVEIPQQAGAAGGAPSYTAPGAEEEAVGGIPPDEAPAEEAAAIGPDMAQQDEALVGAVGGAPPDIAQPLPPAPQGQVRLDVHLRPLSDFSDFVRMRTNHPPGCPNPAPTPCILFEMFREPNQTYSCFYHLYFMHQRRQTPVFYDNWRIYGQLNDSDDPDQRLFFFLGTIRHRYCLRRPSPGFQYMRTDFLRVEPRPFAVTQQSHGVTPEMEQRAQEIFDWVHSGFIEQLRWTRFMFEQILFRAHQIENPTQLSQLRDRRIDEFSSTYGLFRRP